MAFTNDPLNSATDRLRLLIGDTDEYDEGYSDEIYQYVLDKNLGNENQSALELLRMLISKYANYVNEEAGGLVADYSDRFNQYKTLYDMLTKDPRNSIMRAGVGFTGGVSISDRVNTICNPDNRPNPFSNPLRFRKPL